MRKTIAMFLVLTAPTVCASGEFSRSYSPDAIIENRAGATVVRPRNGMAVRIEKFARRMNCEVPPEMAELLAATEYPRVMAAMAYKESRFDVNARGKAGEVGMLQVIPSCWKHPGHTAASQVRTTEEILEELIRERGNLSGAIKSYNGSGPKAEAYRRDVLKLARLI